jgi:hypothetical protein
VREKEREEKWTLMQELTLARAHRHIVRVSSGPYSHKVIYLYLLAIKMAIDDMTRSYSQQLTLLVLALRGTDTWILGRSGAAVS